MNLVAATLLTLLLFSTSPLVVSQDAPINPGTADGILINTTDTGGLSEETKTEDVSSDSETVPEAVDFVEVSASFDEKIEEGEDAFTKQVFAEATTNSGVANDLTTSGQPVVLTLQDAATAELHQRAAIPPAATQDTPQPPQTNHTLTAPTKDAANLTEEEIPSFSEWTQKRLEEAEKNKEPSNASQHSSNGKPGAKLRWKNYASPDCGAKVVASNPEAVSPSAILSPSRDEYKLNTCTSRIWFIVELCEAIQAKKIDLANFELFSSSPKDFSVSVSDRFPTREWSNVGQFAAKDERDVQNFDLHPHLFGKYIKVEVKSHYGSEHYCPISLFRVYGTSEFEVLQKEDSAHSDRLEDDDLDDLDLDNGDSSKNLFSSATDAVISMVKKAASVLGNKGDHSNQTDVVNNNTLTAAPIVRMCTSPSHLIVCDNCSDVLFGQIYELLSCGQTKVRDLIQIPLIRQSLLYTNICQKFGLDFFNYYNKQESSGESLQRNNLNNYVTSFFPDHYLGGMCNSIGVLENKILLNMSSHYSNMTSAQQEDDDTIVNIETSEPRLLQVQTDTSTDEISTVKIVESTTDFSYVEQINPTKTLSDDSLLIKDSYTETPPIDNSSDSVIVDDSLVSSNTTTVNSTVDHKLEVDFSSENLDIEQFINESSTPQGQKESVFLRLSNRIKALERNMSLSGQYLEELSKRYKKQVEEMQKLLEKTVLNMNEEIKKKDEYNQKLEEKLNKLNEVVEDVVRMSHSWSSTVYCVAISVLVTLFVVNFCSSGRHELSDVNVKKAVSTDNSRRRKSVDVLTNGTSKKRRRPSDQALKIVRSSLIEANAKKDNLVARKRHKKKSSTNSEYKEFKPDSNSSTVVWDRQLSAPATVADWVEPKQIEDVPFVLEESEHSSLEPLEKISAPSFFRTALNSRSLRTVEVNGGVKPKEKRGFRKMFKEGFLKKL